MRRLCAILMLMTEPSKLLLKLSQRLFADEGDRAAFLDCLLHPQPLHPCILWRDDRPDEMPFERELPFPWQPAWVDRLAIAEQPGKHPLHAQGEFYCLDFSSVFAAMPLCHLAEAVFGQSSLVRSSPLSPPLLIDLCASPGGKSIFAWRSLQPQLLISNEVVGKRIGTLISNLKRCRISPLWVTNLEVNLLAAEIPKTAQVVVVDAPCSGQSLLAKGGKAPGCFHPVTINGNAKRQKRILANAADLVAGGGFLLYMTCTYSPEENEQVIEWLLKHFSHFAAIAVPALQPYQSHLTDVPCYRLFPQSGLGAGSFTALLQNTQNQPVRPLPDGFCDRARFVQTSAPC
jgi:16S rRNA C967 or C1407 C5-methylase (RsmB/RsmF family)